MSGELWAVAALILAINSRALAADAPPGDDETPTSWGRMFSNKSLGAVRLVIEGAPDRTSVTLPSPHANVTRAFQFLGRGAGPGRVLTFSTDPATAELSLEFPVIRLQDSGGHMLLEAVEKSTQFPDGRITLSALDAVIHGDTAKLESQPGNHRIEHWTNPDDYLSWEYEATRPGRYDVELTYALKADQPKAEDDTQPGKTGINGRPRRKPPSRNLTGKETAVYVAIGKGVLVCPLPVTADWRHYTTATCGQVSIAGPGKVSVVVKCLKKTGDAVMHLKAVTLRPRCEGTPPKQARDGEIVCHARDATIHGVKVQYEPRPEKNTVGYWVVPQDQVSWDLPIEKEGKFDIEILQGCGKGEGGSEVELSIGNQSLTFTVEDTGHFQNFKPRVIGSVRLVRPEALDPTTGNFVKDTTVLWVKPLKMANHAVMDLRQVRLIPKNGD